MSMMNISKANLTRSLKILIVEDDVDFGETLQDSISVLGHKCTLVESAEDVVDVTTQGMFDIYILDINLPDENGLSLASRLRAASPGVGIIMLTARTTDEDIAHGYNFGADIYLSKPVSIHTLESAINSVARRLYQETNTNILLDTSCYKLTNLNTGECVVLTSNEAFVVSAFLSSPKQRLEFWQIGELLNLNMDADFKHAIELHVSRLRKKIITVCGDQIFVKSIRGWGYHLAGEIRIKN